MPGRVLMLQGTMSSVGKSVLVAALCRIFSQAGWRVAPFKAQNLALNAAVTPDGLEVGRAQAMQAEAAGIEVAVEMNPILIKPEAGGGAQVVLRGRPWGRASHAEQRPYHELWWQVVTEALDSLRARYELVIIEGAGSPAELNLQAGDLANSAIAAYARAPVLLVGDIERGGVFAQLLGTLSLLEEQARRRVRGLIVNKFHGDPRLFVEGVRLLEQRSELPVLGVIPFLRQLGLPEEDALGLPPEAARRPAGAAIDIAILRLPHISNFDDFDALAAEPDTVVRFVAHPDQLGAPDLLIIPGTKMTVADLQWLRRQGLEQLILERAAGGTPVLGLCGGYQMLGQAILDPLGVESGVAEVAGLGLLPVVSSFSAQKLTTHVQGRLAAGRGLFAHAGQLDIAGYELHMGRTVLLRDAQPLLGLTMRGGQPIDEPDGCLAAGGRVAGCYLHGLFDNDALRQQLLANLAASKGLKRQVVATRFARGPAYDRLARHVQAHVDIPAIKRLIEEAGTQQE